MKQNLLRFTALLIMMLFTAPGFPAGAGAQKDDAAYAEVFRLHVIANSDSAADQAAKLHVRDAVLAYAGARLSDAASPKEARSRLMADGAQVLRDVEAALGECGMGYGASLEVGTFAFPAREYGGETYPAGDYAALRVRLGAGKGQNWWCVMFPPLCILELPGGEIDYEELKTNSLIIKLLKSIDGGKLWNAISEKLH